MSKVLEFPQDKALERQVEDSLDSLVDLYENLQRGYELLEKIEEAVEEEESKFDEILIRYARAVGLENVPVRYLEYTSNQLTVDLETGTICLKQEE